MAKGMADSDRRGRGDPTNTGDGDSLNIEERDTHLPPIQQRLRAMHDAQNRRYAAENTQYSPYNAEVLAQAGSFIPVAEPSWAAQAAVVNDPRNGLGFNPSRLVDGIIAKKSGIPGLSDPSRSDYARYEGLRANIAVLRNYLRSMGLSEMKLKTIAEDLADAFANDTWLKRPVTRSLSADVAGVEGVGAGEMYKHLLQVQQSPGLFAQSHITITPIFGSKSDTLRIPTPRTIINSLFGLTDRAWGLPPLEATPFSPANLSAPLYASGEGDMAMASSDFVDRYLSGQDASSYYSRA